MMKKFVSIIIPTYNRARTLAVTLDSFLNQNYSHDSYEIIVADNKSTDDTKAVIEQAMSNYPGRVKYLFEPRQGVHYARNSAAKIAEGEILYYTDDDMIADPHLMEEIVKVFDFDSRVASVTGRVLPHWEVDPPDWVVKLCSNGLLSLHNPKDEFVISNRDIGVYSCHQAILREAFFKSGGFNPENTAGEWIGDGETGLNIKIKEMGYLFGYNGKSIIYHSIPASRMTQGYLNKRFTNQGNSDSYTIYRSRNATNWQLRKQIAKHLLALIPQLIGLIKKRIMGDIKWRIHLAKLFYGLSRIKYDYRLTRDAKWRELVKRTNWIDD